MGYLRQSLGAESKVVFYIFLPVPLEDDGPCDLSCECHHGRIHDEERDGARDVRCGGP
jgi:hypothetical protein